MDNFNFYSNLTAQQPKDDDTKVADTAKTIPTSNNQSLFGGALKGKLHRSKKNYLFM